MTDPTPLARATASLAASTAHVEELLDELRDALAAQRSAARRLLDVSGSATAPVDAEAILQAVALDDELMADLDALVEMDTARLSAAVRDRPRNTGPGMDGIADRAVLRTYQAVLADMERQGARVARAVVAGRGDVYHYLMAAADQLADPDRERDRAATATDGSRDPGPVPVGRPDAPADVAR